MVFETSTGKLELHMEKTQGRTGELEEIDKYYYFLSVSQSLFFIYYLFHATLWKVFGKCIKAICRMLRRCHNLG